MTTQQNAPVLDKHRTAASDILDKTGWGALNEIAQLLANLEAANNRLAEIDRIANDRTIIAHLRIADIRALTSGHTPSPEYGRVHTDGSRSGGQEPAKPDFVTEAGTEFHLPKTAPCPGCAAKDEAMAAFKAEVSDAVEAYGRASGIDERNIAYARLSRFIIPPADPVADALKAVLTTWHEGKYSFGQGWEPDEPFTAALAELKSRLPLGGAK